MAQDSKTIAVLGLIQVVVVSYTIFFLHVFRRIIPDEHERPLILKLVLSYGVMMYLVPLLWTIYAAYVASNEEASEASQAIAGLSWVVCTAMLLLIAIVTTIVSLGAGTLVGKTS